MIDGTHRRLLIPSVIVALGVVLYVTMLRSAVPSDLPNYRHAFFEMRAGQMEGLAIGAISYFAGIALCVVAFSSLPPIRSVVLRLGLIVPGLLSAGFGAICTWTTLICFVDKVR